MSDVKKQYAVASGMVQAFSSDGVKGPAVEARQTGNGQTVYGFTIKTATQKYISVSLWEEFAHIAPQIAEGYVVWVEGAYTSNVKNGREYHNISAMRLAVTPCVTRQEREVVNAVPAAAPVAAVAAAPAAAEAAAPASGFNF